MPWSQLFPIEHSRAASRADFAVHAGAVLALAGVLLLRAPHAKAAWLLMLALAAAAGWTLLEYAVHRFVLHGIDPFRRWHLAHHARPQALIYTPTVLVAAAVVLGLALPAWALLGGWDASALTLGLLCGYGVYSVTHHALHQGGARSGWLRRRQRWHAQHHRPGDARVCYGVTSGLWDRAFGSAPSTDACPTAPTPLPIRATTGTDRRRPPVDRPHVHESPP